ncbi:MAG: ATP-binding protein [Armatimonadia bacterium]
MVAEAVPQLVCSTIRENRASCSGWDETPGHTMRCPLYQTDRCPLPVSPEEKQAQRSGFLGRVGFRKRYCSPDLEGLFGTKADPAAEACRALLREYWGAIEQNLASGLGFILSGTVGTGKTYALALTALAANWTGATIRYIYSPDLFDLLHSADERLSLYRSADLLLLDDFGAQHDTDWHVSGFNALMEARHAAELSTCITTNLSKEALDRAEPYRRSIDRWRETCAHMIVLGFDSLRGYKP